MAANEYYNDSSRRYNNYEPSLASTVPPSYTSQPPHNHDRPGASTVSPFETVFDDHVYPTNSHSHQTPDSLNTSQQNFAYDTRYHGPAPGDVSPVGTDEIPLRQQNNHPALLPIRMTTSTTLPTRNLAAEAPPSVDYYASARWVC